MIWPRTILDGISMALLFNALVGVGFLIYPQAYTTMFPKRSRKRPRRSLIRRKCGR